MPVRILFADAEPTLTAMYRRALAGYDFEVAVSHTGPECLAQLRAFHPDVLVVDPELAWGGEEGALARIRQEPDLVLPPVILLCAAFRPEYRAAVEGFPLAGCYEKPLLPNQLAYRIQTLLGCASPSQPTGGRAEAPPARGPAAARQLRPEVVLCDLGLPGMDGLQVAAALRADPATAGARLIAVSGYGQEDDVRRSLEAGFELHLTKPVDPTAWPRLLARGKEQG
jgi:CheY-like chemotaxis protein